MNRLHIDRAYSMHHAWLAGRFEEARAASIQAAEASSGRFPFLAVFDPRREKESLAAMDACLGRAYFIGVKIPPSFHGVPASDPHYDAVWEYAGEHKLPIVTHSWSDTYNPVQKLSLPDLFEGQIRRHPGVPLILGHGGGPGNGQLQAIRLARAYPNVFLDTSGDVFHLDLIPNLVTAIGAERILFGSDQTLGLGAHLWDLCRTRSGPFTWLRRSLAELEALGHERVIPMIAATGLPTFEVDARTSRRVANGVQLSRNEVKSALTEGVMQLVHAGGLVALVEAQRGIPELRTLRVFLEGSEA